MYLGWRFSCCDLLVTTFASHTMRLSLHIWSILIMLIYFIQLVSTQLRSGSRVPRSRPVGARCQSKRSPGNLVYWTVTRKRHDKPTESWNLHTECTYMSFQRCDFSMFNDIIWYVIWYLLSKLKGLLLHEKIWPFRCFPAGLPQLYWAHGTWRHVEGLFGRAAVACHSPK